MKTSTALTVELVSGPRDGLSARVEGGGFVLGGPASVLEMPDSASAVSFEASVADGRLGLSADAEFEHDGASTRSISGVSMPAYVRVGDTEIALLLTEHAELEDGGLPSAGDLGQGGSGTSGSAAPAGARTCVRCGLVNEPGNTWCSRCGEDLP